MNNSKEIIMIYANAEKKDIGVLQDYSFDMCYGHDENTFECRLQKYNDAFKGDDPIDQDFILYIEFTEYGGIIDKKEINTKTGEIVLSGRTWHGFLNSYVIEPPKGEATRDYRGEANTVLNQIFSDIGMSDWFEAVDEDSGITIRYTEVRYKKAYDTILDMLETEDAKLVMWYQSEGVIGGKIYVKAISRVNTGAFEDFDTSQVPFKAGIAYNTVNELICLGGGTDVNRAVIHIYINENGEILPYTKVNGVSQDSNYFTDIDALATSSDPFERQVYQMIQDVITPASERFTAIFDYPNAETRITYENLAQRPSNWKSSYPNYFYLDRSQGTPEYKQFEREYKDKFELLKSKPSDWKSNYKDYYMKEKNSSTAFKKVEELSEAQGAVIKYTPSGGMQSVNRNEWKNYFEVESEDKPDLYYEKTGMYGQEWKKVEPVQHDNYIYMIGMKKPRDWKENYSNYYLRKQTGTGYEYISVPGISKTTYPLLTKMPDDWRADYGNYYMKATIQVLDDYKPIKKGQYITVADAISNGMLDEHYQDKWGFPHEYPKWKKNTFYDQVTITNAPGYSVGIWDISEPGQEPIFVQGPYYKETIKKAPTFEAGKYYQKYVDGTPRFQKQGSGDEDFGGYYRKKEHVEIIPTFNSNYVFFQKIDRYYELCKAGERRLREYANADTLDISLELESNYDVGDIVGGIDEETGINVIKPIRRKIIKIKKGILSINYEVD